MKYLVVVILLFSNILFAQNKWAGEFRPGLNFVTEHIGEAKLDIGFGFGVNIAYNFIKNIEGYVGWGYNTFTSDVDSSTNFDEIGYTFGLQYIHPLNASSPLSYFFRVGGIYNKIKVDYKNSDITKDTDRGFGLEIGAGLDYKLGESTLSLRTQIGYRVLSRDIEIGNINTPIDLNYLVFGVGLTSKFKL